MCNLHIYECHSQFFIIQTKYYSYLAKTECKDKTVLTKDVNCNCLFSGLSDGVVSCTYVHSGIVSCS